MNQIIKQPNGLWALWSSIVDNFVLTDATEQDLIDYFVEREKEQWTAIIKDKISKLNRGVKAYWQFTMTYEEAMKRRRLNEI